MRKTLICLVGLFLFGTAALFAGSAPVSTTDCNVTDVDARHDTFTCVSGTTEWIFHVHARTRYNLYQHSATWDDVKVGLRALVYHQGQIAGRVVLSRPPKDPASKTG
jgi:hypothetical protein